MTSFQISVDFTMCSSDPEAELSLSGPAMGTRKRCSDTSLTFSDFNEGEDIGEEGGNNNSPDSDEDFVIEKKKKKVKSVKGKKASKELNNSTISKTSTSSSDVCIPIPPDESNFIIEVQLMKEETPTESEEGFKCKTDVERPVTIATPDQINSRSFDQEESMTPSSCSTPMEEKIAKDSSNIVHKLVEQVLKAQTPVKSILKTSEEINIKVLPKPKSNHPNWPCGRGRGWRPGHPLRPGQVGQPAPGTRPPVRAVGPRMSRPLRPGLPSGYRPSQAVPRPGMATGSPGLPNIRSTNPIKRRSLSTPQYSQCTPPVVELDASPPRSDVNINVSHPPANTIVNKLTSMGLGCNGEGSHHQARLGSSPRIDCHKDAKHRGRSLYLSP